MLSAGRISRPTIIKNALFPSEPLLQKKVIRRRNDQRAEIGHQRKWARTHSLTWCMFSLLRVIKKGNKNNVRVCWLTDWRGESHTRRPPPGGDAPKQPRASFIQQASPAVASPSFIKHERPQHVEVNSKGCVSDVHRLEMKPQGKLNSHAITRTHTHIHTHTLTRGGSASR